MLHGAKTIEHIVKHLGRWPFQRLPKAAAAWTVEYMHVAGGHAHT